MEIYKDIFLPVLEQTRNPSGLSVVDFYNNLPYGTSGRELVDTLEANGATTIDITDPNIQIYVYMPPKLNFDLKNNKVAMKLHNFPQVAGNEVDLISFYLGATKSRDSWNGVDIMEVPIMAVKPADLEAYNLATSQPNGSRVRIPPVCARDSVILKAYESQIQKMLDQTAKQLSSMAETV